MSLSRPIEPEELALMASTAFEIPTLVERADLPLIEGWELPALLECHPHEAVERVRRLGLTPLPPEEVAENLYILCGGGLLYLGRFTRGAIPPCALSGGARCADALALHSHPIPLPIPTPEDLESSWALGYRAECVISLLDGKTAALFCVDLRGLKPSEELQEVYEEVARSLLTLSKYLLVGDEEGVLLLPFPSREEALRLLKEYADAISSLTRIYYARLSLSDGRLEVGA